MAATPTSCSGRTTLMAPAARVGARVVRSDRAGSSRDGGKRGIAAHGAAALRRPVRAPTVGVARLRGRQLCEPLRAVVGHMTTSREPSPTRQQSALLDESSTVNVLGLGQAMVDFSAQVEQTFLDGLITDAVCTDLESGGRCCVDAEQRGAVLTALEGNTYKLSAGGSLSNTLVALSRLVEQHTKCTREHADGGVVVTEEQEGEESAAPVNVSIACSLGPDPLGDFYRTKVKHYGVHVLSEPGDDGTTGSVIVLTTPDAQRTMLSCWGTSASLPYDQTLDDAVAASDVLVIEGYLWEMPETIRSIKRALRTAKANGVTVAFTASDRTCVERHGDEFWQLLRSGDVDVLFCNREEALAMTGAAPDGLVAGAASETVDALAQHASTVIVTDGSQGAYLRRGDERVHVPPHWLDSPPVDTCGAGDAYAAGCLFGMLQGRALPAVGAMGARVASVVIAQAGARLSERDAAMLMQDPLFADTAETFPFQGKASPHGTSQRSPRAAARAEGWGKLSSHLNSLKRDGK